MRLVHPRTFEHGSTQRQAEATSVTSGHRSRAFCRGADEAFMSPIAYLGSPSSDSPFPRREGEPT